MIHKNKSDVESVDGVSKLNKSLGHDTGNSIICFDHTTRMLKSYIWVDKVATKIIYKYPLLHLSTSIKPFIDHRIF